MLFTVFEIPSEVTVVEILPLYFQSTFEAGAQILEE